MKNEKTTWVFVFQKCGKFWTISLGHFIQHKPLISEEWCLGNKIGLGLVTLIHNLNLTIGTFFNIASTTNTCLFEFDTNLRKCKKKENLIHQISPKFNSRFLIDGCFVLIYHQVVFLQSLTTEKKIILEVM